MTDPEPPLDPPEPHVCFESPYGYCDDGEIYSEVWKEITGKFCLCSCHQEPDPVDLDKARRER